MPLLGTKPAYCWRASWSRASNSSLGSVKRARRAFMVARDDSIAARVSALGTFSRSEEHTSELQSLMRISYAVFCLKEKTPQDTTTSHYERQITEEKHTQEIDTACN